MSSFRLRIENGFESLGRFIYRRKYWFALGVVLFASLMASQLPKTTVDTSPLGMLRADSPAMLDYNDFRDQFGRDELIICAVGPVDVFDPVFLKKLEAFHQDLEDSVPLVDEVTSLINARDTRGEEDTLVVGELLEDWLDGEGDLKTAKKRALQNSLFQNMILSPKGDFTAVVVSTEAYSSSPEDDDLGGFGDAPARDFEETRERTLPYLSGEENGRIIEAVLQVIARHETADFPVHLAGTPAMAHMLQIWTLHDMRLFLALTLAVISLLLLVIFRRVAAVIWPLTTVILSILCTLGLMAWSGTPLKMPTQILPSFLISVGIADSVHILAIFYRRLAAGDGKEEAIANTLGHSGLAVMLTSLTTAGALASFSTAEIAPIADLGVFACCGVLLAMLFSILWMPAMLSIFPAKARKIQEPGATRLDKFLAGIGDFATSRPWPILLVTAALIAAAALGAARLHFSHNPVTWFPKDFQYRMDSETIDAKMGGAVTMEIIVDTGKTNGLYDPETMEKLSRLSRAIEAMETRVPVGQTQSAADVLKEINQALHANDPSYYTIPKSRDLVAQEFLLFSNTGSDDLEELVDSDFSLARFTIKAASKDASTYVVFADRVEKMFREAFPEYKITATGFLTILFRTMNAVMHTMVKSYLIAFVVISILMVLLIGSVRVGLIAMVPNLTPILIVLGIMGWLGLPLDAMTILVGSVAIGLAVDDTIHFLHNFRRYFDQTGDVKQAVHMTMQTTGRALLFTSVALCTGFMIFVFAKMILIRQFGILTGTAIALALLADFFVAPALLTVIYKNKKPRQAAVATTP